MSLTYPSKELQPGSKILLLAASATVPLDPRPRYLWITVDGTISIENDDGTSVTDMIVKAGQRLDLQPYLLTAQTDAVVYGISH